MSPKSWPAAAKVIAGLGFALAGVALIYLNLRSARRSGPEAGTVGLVRAVGSWVAVVAGAATIFLGLSLLISAAAIPTN
jgi:hypothetical protein